MLFFPDRCFWAMPWQHPRRIRQNHQAFAQGAQNPASIAPGKIGSPYRSGKERIAGQQQMLCREVKADAARRVARRMQHLGRQGGEANGQAIVGTGIRRCYLGRGNAEPASLDLHHAQQTQVLLVEKHRRPGSLSEQGGAAYVVDMGMSDDDLAQGETMLLQPGEDFGDVVTGIDNQGFVRDFVPQDGAIAMERTDGKALNDHRSIVGDRL